MAKLDKSRWMYKDGPAERIPTDEVDNKVQQGWKFGRPNTVGHPNWAKKGIPKTKSSLILKYGYTEEQVKKAKASGLKWCIRHKKFEDPSLFAPAAGTKTCRLGRKEDDRDEYKINRILKRYYRKDPQWYKDKLAAQGGHCALCPEKSTDISRSYLCVDHNHLCCNKRYTCGKCTRGLCCQSCNFWVSKLEILMERGLIATANPGTWSEKALAYLQQYAHTNPTSVLHS